MRDKPEGLKANLTCGFYFLLSVIKGKSSKVFQIPSYTLSYVKL